MRKIKICAQGHQTKHRSQIQLFCFLILYPFFAGEVKDWYGEYTKIPNIIVYNYNRKVIKITFSSKFKARKKTILHFKPTKPLEFLKQN